MGIEAFISHPEMELRLMNIFVMVVETGTMTATAQKLKMTQSAVSQSINHLEERLGTRLIDRTTRPLALTAPGSVLYEESRQILEMAQKIATKVRTSNGGSLPKIRIGLAGLLATIVGPELFKTHLNAARNWVICGTQPDAHVQAIKNREMDIAITTGSVEYDDDLEVHNILWEPLVLALPKAFKMPADDLAGLAKQKDFIGYSSQSSIQRQIESHLHRLSIHLKKRWEVNDDDTVLSMVNIGAGWTITTPAAILQARPLYDNIKFMPLPGPSLRRCTSLVARRDEYSVLIPQMTVTIHNILEAVYLPVIQTSAPWASANTTLNTIRKFENIIPMAHARHNTPLTN